MIKKTAILLFILCAFPLSAAAEREERQENFRVGQVLRDREPGPFQEWTERLPERPIQRIVVNARRESGTADTQLELGLEGASVGVPTQQVDSEQLREIVWDLGGERPVAREIDLQAKHGQVYVESVRIEFADSARGAMRDESRRGEEAFSRQEFERIERNVSELDSRTERALETLEDDRELSRSDRIADDLRAFSRDVDRFEDNIERFREDRSEFGREVRNLRRDADDLLQQVDREASGSRLEDDLEEISDLLQDIEQTANLESPRRSGSQSIFPF